MNEGVEGPATAEFAFPGPLRDRLVAAILTGAKTATSSLLAEYERDGDALPQTGGRSVVVDSAGRAVAVIETASVRVVALGDMDDDAFAAAEGESTPTVAAWRAVHETFWRSPEYRDALGDPPITVDDTTPVVLERFRLVRRLDGGVADAGSPDGGSPDGCPSTGPNASGSGAS